MQLNTTQDAIDFVENSGVSTWQWEGAASAEDFANWLYENYDEIDRDNYDAELKAYIISKNQDPADYGI